MNLAVVGVQWGDEGKGKVVDLYSRHVDYIVRFQGGNNAGHTLVVNGKQTILHIIPSGVLHPGKTCLIASGVVFDPLNFFKEITSLQETGVLHAAPHELIQVSDRAHVILPYHLLMDRLREERAGQGKGKIGTTIRGIGPAYEDKVARRGIQVIDLLKPQLLREKLQRAIEEKNVLLKNLFQVDPIQLDEVYENCIEIGKKLKPYISDVRATLTQALAQKKPILFEGAQGTLLDLDHGTYPYVTSSNTISGGVYTGSGLGPGALDQIIGIAKAYATRVGTGPFPTELKEGEQEIGQKLQKIGAEFGATTGRPRRTGWLDLVALKYASEVNGLTGLALMKADVLNGFEKLKVCTEYEVQGRTTQNMPSCVEDLESATPIYTELPGWEAYDTKMVRSKKDLPKELQNYIQTIENYLGIPIVLLSTGPGREETLEISSFS